MLTTGSFHPQPTKGAYVMFTRIVELTTKPGKNKQLSDTISHVAFTKAGTNRLVT